MRRTLIQLLIWCLISTFSHADGIDANTVFLCHMDGPNDTNTFTDSSPSPKSITANSTAHIDTDNSKFGGASLLLSGSGAALVLADADDYTFPGNFTLDFWIKRSGTTAARNPIMTKAASSTWTDIEWAVTIESSHKVMFQLSNNGSDTGAITILSTTLINNSTTWYHVAAVRNGNRFDLYINGTSEANGTSALTVKNGTAVVSIGDGYGGAYFLGNIDEARISNVARWTANFTPPSSAYTEVVSRRRMIELSKQYELMPEYFQIKRWFAKDKRGDYQRYETTYNFIHHSVALN